MWLPVIAKPSLLTVEFISEILGFFHDHLFVPEGEEERVMEALRVLSESISETSEEETGEEEEDEIEAFSDHQDE